MQYQPKGTFYGQYVMLALSFRLKWTCINFALKQKIVELSKQGIITKVEEPTLGKDQQYGGNREAG